MRLLRKRGVLVLLCAVGLTFGSLGAFTAFTNSSLDELSIAAFNPLRRFSSNPESLAVQAKSRTSNDEPASVAKLLCDPSPGGPITFTWGTRLGVAAEPAGRFALYTHPDPQNGRPTGRSEALLDGCGSGAPWYTNYAAVKIDSLGSSGARTVPLGLSTLARSDAGPDGQGTTPLHRAGDGIFVSQTLTLLGPSDRADGTSGGSPGQPGLQIEYQITNRSDKSRNVGVRSTLNPGLESSAEAGASGNAKATSTQAPFLFKASGSPLERISYEREIDAEEVSAIFSGGASPNGSWEPGPVGPPPDAVTFAAPSTLYAADFHHDPRSGYPLPPGAAFAVFWKDLELAPGQTVTVSHHYGPLGDAGGESGRATPQTQELENVPPELGVRFEY